MIPQIEEVVDFQQYPFEKFLTFVNMTFKCQLPNGYFDYLEANTNFETLFLESPLIEGLEYQSFLIGGSLFQWRHYILKYCVAKTNRSLRFFFNYCNDYIFSTKGDIFPDYYKSDNRDETYVLKLK